MSLKSDPAIMDDWEAFLEYIERVEKVGRKTWAPCYYSIKLWNDFREYTRTRKIVAQEYKKSKRK